MNDIIPASMCVIKTRIHGYIALHNPILSYLVQGEMRFHLQLWLTHCSQAIECTGCHNKSFRCRRLIMSNVYKISFYSQVFLEKCLRWWYSCYVLSGVKVNCQGDVSPPKINFPRLILSMGLSSNYLVQRNKLPDLGWNPLSSHPGSYSLTIQLLGTCLLTILLLCTCPGGEDHGFNPRSGNLFLCIWKRSEE